MRAYFVRWETYRQAKVAENLTTLLETKDAAKELIPAHEECREFFFANFAGTLLEYAQIYFRHRRSNVSTHKICAHQSLSRSIPEGTMRHSDKMAKWSAFV